VQLDALFASLFDELRRVLSSTLGAPVALHPEWARPAFRIVPAGRGAHLPVAPVHCDTEHRTLNPGASYAMRPISFTLLVSNDDSGAGVTQWELSTDETIGLDTEETSRLLDEAPRTTHPITRGELFVHAADVYHQTTPRSNRSAGVARISLDGHAILVSGTWLVYG
jgi:hypothetical protein